MDTLRDDTGLFGIAGHREAAHRVVLGLSALAHRGAGLSTLVVSERGLLRRYRREGALAVVFDGSELARLPGRLAVGAVHDSGGEIVFGRYLDGQLGIGVAGRFTNGQKIRRELKESGVFLRDGSDAEVLAHLIARSTKTTLVNRVVDALWSVEGAFSLLVVTEERLIAVRDPRGFRPLVYGSLGDATVFATEDVALQMAGARMTGELKPGQMAIADSSGKTLFVTPFPTRPRTTCVQEVTVLSDPGATLESQSVYGARVALGERLAREQGVLADVVVGVGSRGTAAALGYAHASGLPYRQGLVDAPGGTVVVPGERPGGAAWARVRPVRSVLYGQRVVMVVPTLTSGGGITQLADLVRDAGAREVHLRVASPPVRYTCPYGVSALGGDELLAPNVPDLMVFAERLHVASVGFLSREGFHRIVGQRADGQSLFCDACLSGEFPVASDAVGQLPLFEV